jgi:hypothetical protein
MQELHRTKNFVVYATEDGGLKIEAPPGRSTVWFGTGRGRSHIVLGDGLALLPLMEGQAGWAFGHRYPAFDLIEVQE